MIVLDASAALSALMNVGAARTTIANEQLHAPHLIDADIANGLRRQLFAGRIAAADASSVLTVWRALAVSRYGTVSMLDRIWELRDNLSAYDAAYVALAEALDCALLTADARLSRAVGIRCPVTTVPR